MPLPALIAGGIALFRGATIAATIAPLVKPAVGVAKGIAKRFSKQTARPGIGSKVTSGPLMLGKKRLLGPSPRGGTVVRAGAGALTLGGISAVASHRRAPAPQTRPQPARSTPRPSTKTGTRKCCPVGTKRMVCFKRGRTKKAKKKSSGKRKFSAKQLANQRRFAAAARARRKR